MLQAPLEQFQILSLIPLNFFFFDFSITNFLLINLLALFSFMACIYYSNSHNNYLQESSFFLIPNSWQKSIESISELTSQLISDIITTDNEKYFPIVSIIFNFILFSNLIGLVPYSFTATSHLIVSAPFNVSKTPGSFDLLI